MAEELATRTFLALATLLVLSLLMARPAHAAEFTVTNTNNSGTGSLRQAILDANAASTDDTINFGIPSTDPNCNDTTDVCTISPTSLLPTITDKVTIDGYSQPGADPNSAITNANNADLKIELSGAIAPSNAFGLAVSGAGASGTTIKGLVINDFGDDGVFVSNSAPNTTIEGNFIGTNADGDADLGNGSDGVTLLSSGNTVGGPANAAQNVISGNGENGVAVKQSDAAGNTISNNHIGTDANADEDLGNSLSGVFVEDASDNTVGGNGATGAGNGANGEGNIISGNDEHGVRIIGEDAAGARVLGNFIGLNRNGNGFSDIGNTLDGVLVSSTPRVEIGGMEEGQGNTISDNDQNGVEIAVFSATDNEVLGNCIGTNFNGSSAFGNAMNGVRVVGPPNTTIGGTDADDGAVDGAVDARNVISGNLQNGVFISGGLNATNNKVEGNRIGTDANGTSDLGNSGSGVRVEAPGSFVGGTAPGAGNLISGNGGAGILFNGSNTVNNLVEGNLIGTNATGTGNLANQHGVRIAGAIDNTVGGTLDAAANTISGNTNQGVFVSSCTCAAGNRILRNSIFENGGLGIELGLLEDGPNNPQDRKDGDTGPNNLQNYPVLSSASTTQIKGTLNSRPRKTFTIQFFSSPTADSSSFGEGKTFLGEKAVRTNREGKASFTFTAALSAEEVVTATATRNSTGDTSEFSKAREVQ